MANKNRLREWATPLTIGAFFLSGVTGVLLFFKANLPLVQPIHEWLSWLLIVGSVFHLLANWRASLQYVRKPLGRYILVPFLLFIFISLIPLGSDHDGDPARRAVGAMITAPLLTVAQIAGHGGDEVLTILESRGIHAKSNKQTIAEVASANGQHPMHVLDAIF